MSPSRLDEDRDAVAGEGQRALDRAIKAGDLTENEIEMWQNVFRRLIRMETGRFPQEEAPTAPEKRTASSAFHSAVKQLSKEKK